MTEWMIVHTTDSLADAHIVAGRLQVEGIPSFIQRETLGEIIGITYGTLGKINVVVRPTDYERAVAVLEPDELYALTDDNDNIVYYSPHPDEPDDHE